MTSETVCPKCGDLRKDSDIESDVQCPNCGVFYKKYEAIQNNIKQEQEIWRENSLSQLKREKTKSHAILVNLLILFPLSMIAIIVPNFIPCGTSVSLFILVIAVSFLLHQMVKHKVSFGGKYNPISYYEDEAPVRFKIEIIGCVVLIIWFGYLGISSLTQECF